MSVFVIADLHLSTNRITNKSMEVFGKRWTGYTEKLQKNWKAVVSEEDTVIIPQTASIQFPCFTIPHTTATILSRWVREGGLMTDL